MWISRKKAIGRMVEATGLGKEYCRELVMRLKVHPQGVYKKVLDSDVERVIRTLNMPEPVREKGRVKLSRSQILRIQTAGM